VNNYLNMCYKQAKLNTEWFFMLLGCECTTEEKDLQKTLENKCPVVKLNKELVKWKN
tara:strand:+ start:4082 stop:4252 length:171 start_codon:yes stop_codon:yes gene_type:complete